MIKIVTLIDLRTIVLTRLFTLVFSLQYLSESCFGNDNKFLLPNPGVVLFFIYPTFYSLKLLFPLPPAPNMTGLQFPPTGNVDRVGWD